MVSSLFSRRERAPGNRLRALRIRVLSAWECGEKADGVTRIPGDRRSASVGWFKPTRSRLIRRRSEAGEQPVSKTGAPRGVVGSSPTVSARVPNGRIGKTLGVEPREFSFESRLGSLCVVYHARCTQRPLYPMPVVLNALIAHRIERNPAKAENLVQFQVGTLNQ